MKSLSRLTPAEFLKIQKRFWTKVQKSGENDCWIWKAATDKDGYGKFKIKTTTTRANRVAYELAKGPIEDSLIILHSCDNPPCVNPNHLSIGTKADNHQDMVNKGRKKYFFGDENGARKHPERLRRGEDHAMAKLNWEQVEHIRESVRLKRFTQRQLAEKYKISPATVCLIIKNKIWAKHE